MVAGMRENKEVRECIEEYDPKESGLTIYDQPFKVYEMKKRKESEKNVTQGIQYKEEYGKWRTGISDLCGREAIECKKDPDSIDGAQ